VDECDKRDVDIDRWWLMNCIELSIIERIVDESRVPAARIGYWLDWVKHEPAEHAWIMFEENRLLFDHVTDDDMEQLFDHVMGSKEEDDLSIAFAIHVYKKKAAENNARGVYKACLSKHDDFIEAYISDDRDYIIDLTKDSKHVYWMYLLKEGMKRGAYHNDDINYYDD